MIDETEIFVSRLYECEIFCDIKRVTVLREFLNNLVDRPSWSSISMFLFIFLSCTFLRFHELASLQKSAIFVHSKRFICHG